MTPILRAVAVSAKTTIDAKKTTIAAQTDCSAVGLNRTGAYLVAEVAKTSGEEPRLLHGVSASHGRRPTEAASLAADDMEVKEPLVAAEKRTEWACKPGYVESSHFSGTTIARRLVRPTRKW